ncbi:YicC/YloC family endoribonuclease [Psychroflexus maritimus]|uniref:YicC family protein n=1 Tax=Psychroflexus maritimus TaxID=2714865 RepID=A0A967AAV6_9FLAO|nr:YicC/YloC family endoribonuclease [Psychroflexus maritimus]NGZ88857.1 YicC family protein [Psychroflexus maritimus]
MIKSMTGYGKSLCQLPTKNISIEIKSLNSKNLDLNARMPSQYREKELEMRQQIAASLQRGKVDFSMQLELTGEETSAKINHQVVKAYLNELQQIKLVDETQNAKMLELALSLPDSVSNDKSEVEATEFEAIKSSISEALEKINEYRLDEGKALEKDFRLRIKRLQELLEQVIEIDPERIKNVRERLQNSVKELKTEVDENRFEQELVFYIEKYDITEEKIRLDNHLNYFLESLSSKDSNGKKLNFIGQEIGREINTIGSKSNFAPMQKLVVEMKDELEKIKEQMLNVL